MKFAPPIRRGEAFKLALSFLYFMLLMACYYVLRPVRDGLVSGLGTDEVKFLTALVLIAMLLATPIYGALLARWPRKKMLPAIYGFAACNLLAFAALFNVPAWLDMATRAFYVWINVFNFFAVSLFWSFMADIWNEEQGRRLFGAIAAGGSTGGLVGPALAHSFAERVGNSGLMLIAAILLCAAIACLWVLANRVRGGESVRQASAFGGSSWQGVQLVLRSPFLLGITALVAIGSIVGMFAYIELGRLAGEGIATPAARTAFFAQIDLWTNAATFILQAGVVGVLASRFGIRAPLLGLSLIGVVSFIPIAVAPSLATLAITNSMRRAAEYGLGKTGRDMLYTVATPQEKYLAKNVIDTVIYRTTDVTAAWLHTVLIALGATLAHLGWISAALMTTTIFISLAVARGYATRRAA